MSGPGAGAIVDHIPPSLCPASDTTSQTELGDAAAAALASLPEMTVGRLRSLLAAAPASATWDHIRAGPSFAEEVLGASRPRSRRSATAGSNGNTAVLARLWSTAARAVDLVTICEANRVAGVAVHQLGDADYPSVLAGDPQAPAVLFSRGRLDILDQPRTAVVGTRSSTHYGQDVAAELGRELARAGVVVVSGLAWGIDGSAHEGALAGGSAPPAGVVASGLDVVYPRRHARLWNRVAAAGVLLSEAPLGTAPQAWRFPLRNRIIAAMAQVVVVVECHRGGGSLHTVEAAAERGIPVLAVPGSVRSPASEGTNALLADGCQPARDVDDVLAALNLECTGRAAPGSASPGPELAKEEGAVLSALDWQPAGTEEVMRRTGMAFGDIVVILDRLEEMGLARGGGGWWERASSVRRQDPSGHPGGPRR